MSRRRSVAWLRPAGGRGFPGAAVQAVYRASAGVYSDVDGATPCAAGDPVRRWADSGGVGRNAAEATHCPTLQYEAGAPVLDFALRQGLTVPSLSDGTPDDWSVHWVAKNTGSRAADNPVLQLTDQATYENALGNNYGSTTGYYYAPPNNYAAAGTGWYAVSVCRSSATGKVSVHVDGVLAQRQPSQLTLPVTAYRIGYVYSPTPYTTPSLVGRVAELVVAYADHGALAAQVNGYFRSRWGALLAPPAAVVVWVGDSNSGLVYSGRTTNVPALACEGAGLSTYYNLAIRDSNTADWLNDAGNATMGGWTEPYTNAVRLAGSRGASKRVVVLWLGANDIDGPRNPAALLANVQTMAARATAAGCKVVVGTVPPCGELGPPETEVVEADRAAYNTSLRAWAATADDVFLADTDTTAINTKPIDGAYTADGSHLNAAGAAVVAPVFQSAIEAALA